MATVFVERENVKFSMWILVDSKSKREWESLYQVVALILTTGWPFVLCVSIDKYNNQFFKPIFFTLFFIDHISSLGLLH
jgi:hypothetical protein